MNGFVKKYIDLAAEKIGGQVVFATDDFFAEKENLIKEGRGIFIPDRYTDRGKWMDGWESKRKRDSGNDWVIVKMGVKGKIKGLNIDTNHFLGNHPPFASVEAIYLEDDIADWTGAHALDWDEVLVKSPLQPGQEHFFETTSEKVYSHVRLHIYPDGGVARFRVFGEVHMDWNIVDKNELIDLALVTHGGKALRCNDMFFSAMDNLIFPAHGKNMGDGWETKRNRTPNNVDWVILRLGHCGLIKKIIVDTKHFKGNYPEKCSIEACNSLSDERVMNGDVQWIGLLKQQNLMADKEHVFNANSIEAHQPITHVKLNIYPDGGVSRLRMFGIIK